MLKPIRALLFLCMAIFGLQAMAQQNISEGIIKYKEVVEPGKKDTSLFSVFRDIPIEFSFSDMMHKMYMFNFQSVTTYKPSGNPEKGYVVYGSILGDPSVYTEPYEEDYADKMFGIDIGKFKSISYDKRDTKTILGYDCYRASLLLADGSRQVYFITDKIKAPGYKHQGQNISIDGYPLEIQLFEDNKLHKIFRAVEISPGLPSGCFNLPTGSFDIKPMHRKATKPAKPL